MWPRQESQDGFRFPIPNVRAGLGFGDFLGLREKAFFLHVMPGAACPSQVDFFLFSNYMYHFFSRLKQILYKFLSFLHHQSNSYVHRVRGKKH
jgi:hypothetical protein